MYKILVVDDMTLIRKGIIKMIDWEKLNSMFAGEAENGRKAIELIKNVNPDIIIMDMRMPEMDGTALLKYISKNSPHIQTIVISGYDDFEYAQQAIKNGSIDYILKPVNSEELNNSIKKACEVIYKNNYYTGKNKLACEYFYQVFHGKDLNLKELLKYLDISELKKYKVNVAVIRHRANIAIEAEVLQNCLKQADNYKEAMTFSINPNEIIIIKYCEYRGETDIPELSVFLDIENFLINNLKDNRIIMGIGEMCIGFENVYNSYKTSYESLVYCILDEKNHIFNYSNTSLRNQYYINIEEYAPELLANVTSGNISGTAAIVNSLFDKIISKDNISLDCVILFVSDFCHILLKIDTNILDEIQNFLKKLRSAEYIFTFQSIENIKRVVFNLYSLKAKKYNDEQGGKVSIISNVINFIQKNYSSEIGLEEISKLYYINPSYLSKIFKQETEENISGYITKIRIEKAKVLLKTGNIKIPNIAQMTGFNDYIYFYKVFKKVTGMTPKEFKES